MFQVYLLKICMFENESQFSQANSIFSEELHDVLVERAVDVNTSDACSSFEYRDTCY